MVSFLVFMIILVVGAVAGMAWWFFKLKLQVRLLELLLTLIACSAAMGAAIRDVGLQDEHDSTRMTAGLVIGCIVIVPILIGAFWGLLWCKRGREERTGVRLGYVILGWFLPAAPLALLYGLQVVRWRKGFDFTWPEIAAMSIALVVLALGALVERNVQKREALRKRKG